MDKVFGLQSKLINLLTSGRLVVLSVLVMSLFAATAPATAQAISTYQPSTFSAVYTSECRSNCATRSTNQSYGYGTSTYRGGYANYGSNYAYGYGSANYRNYNIGGMFAGYTPRIYNNSYSQRSAYGYGQRYYNYRQPPVGQYIGDIVGQYLQSRISNRGNCVSGSGCVVNRAVTRPNYSISPTYDNGTQTYSNNQYQNGNMSYQDDSASVSAYSNDSSNYSESTSADYQEGSVTYR